MYQSQAFRLGPSRAPKIVKWTILATLVISFFSLITNALFVKVFNIPSLHTLLSLSSWGMHKFFIWQLFSYLFVQPMGGSGISMGMIIHLFFNLYILWAIGSTIVESKGKNHFIALYLGGALFVGIVAYLSLLFFQSPLPLAGATTSIYILLIAWVFLVPEALIMVFFILPVRAKWLVFGLLGINLFLDLSNGNFFSFAITLAALFYGYFYSVLVLEMLGPFQRLHEMEKKLIYVKRKQHNYFKKAFNINIGTSKIYDFKTGKAVIQDDVFMDACLEKISQRGKASLTLRERLRMWRISRKTRP